MRLRPFTLFLFISTIGSHLLYSQGCSDAGFCTLDSFKPQGDDTSKVFHNQFKIGAFFGSADNNIAVFGNYLEYQRKLSKKISLDAKLTTLAQNGNGISVFGLSDFFLNANYSTNQKIKFSLGLKLPLSTANSSLNQLPLPMDYQASLGTVDLIIGVGYEYKKFQFVAALQQPITQNNNAFLASAYPENNALSRFQSTRNFTRAGDVLLRVSYPFKMSPKFKLTPSILPIYHLTNDQYTDEFNVARTIEKSQGLTLNGNLYFDYRLNANQILQLNLGIPFVVRESRPDGITRSFIANLEYRIGF